MHLDGYNFLPYLSGEVDEGPREQIFYFGQGGELNAIRWNDWKVHFAMLEGNITDTKACFQAIAKQCVIFIRDFRLQPLISRRPHRSQKKTKIFHHNCGHLHEAA